MSITYLARGSAFVNHAGCKCTPLYVSLQISEGDSVSWQKSLDRWLAGRIDPEVSADDVKNWLRTDPVWNEAKLTWNDKGSHFVTIHIYGIGQVLPTWSGDVLQVATTKGQYVKKWVVEQLVKAYEQLQDL